VWGRAVCLSLKPQTQSVALPPLPGLSPSSRKDPHASWKSPVLAHMPIRLALLTVEEQRTHETRSTILGTTGITTNRNGVARKFVDAIPILAAILIPGEFKPETTPEQAHEPPSPSTTTTELCQYSEHHSFPCISPAPIPFLVQRAEHGLR
jgi:hypothetical protein